MSQRDELADRVRKLRLARKLTQEELGAEIGKSRAHVAKIETDGDKPGRETLVALARFFKVSLDYLEPGASGADQGGYFVDDPDKLALLSLWDDIEEPDRDQMMRILKAAYSRNVRTA